MRWENASVTNLNHIMDTVTQNFLTFEKIKTLIKSNNFIRYYTLISNIPTDIKKCLKDNIDNTCINTENFHPKDDFLDRLINTKSLKFVYTMYYFTEDINSSSYSNIFEMGRNTWD